MKLENYINQGQYKDTVKLAYEIKHKYGINEYYIFKKMCMIAASQIKKDPFRFVSYDAFLSQCFHQIYTGKKITTVYRLDQKKHWDDAAFFFGLPVTYIFDLNTLKLDEMLTKPKTL